MKILFLSHYFPPEVNAPASRTYDNAKRWVAAGHKVTVITGAPNAPNGVLFPGYRNRWIQKEYVDGIQVIRVWTFLAPNRGAARRILNYLSFMVSAVFAGLLTARPEILAATSPQFFCGLAGVALKKLRQLPFVLEIRDIWPESITTVGAMKKGAAIRFLESLERAMYRSADTIVAVGRGYKQRIMEKGIPSEKIEVIYNGVDLSIYQKASKDRGLEEKYGLVGKQAVAYVGTVGMAHALEIMLRAAAKVKNSDLVFLIVGDGARYRELSDEARQRGLSNVVFTGLLPKKEMPRIWSLVDICFIHLKKSPLFETVIPSKMFEAMAMEIPIIMGVAGEAGELVTRAEAGIAMEPENTEKFLEAIEQLTSNGNEARAVGRRGREFVARFFDRNQLAADYLKILERTAVSK